MLILYGFMFLSSLILVNPLKTMPALSFDVLKIQHAEDAPFRIVIPAISRTSLLFYMKTWKVVFS